MTYFILGRHYSYEKEDSLSYDYLVKAEKIFTKNKDTTGMLYCYRQLRLSVHENYIDLAKQYFKKLIALSTNQAILLISTSIICPSCQQTLILKQPRPPIVGCFQ